MVGPDDAFEHRASGAIAGKAQIHMVAVPGKAQIVVGPAGPQVLQHGSGGDDPVETAFRHGASRLACDHLPHRICIRERLGDVLRLGKVVIGLGKDIIVLRRGATFRLIGLEFGQKPVYGRFLFAGPAPGKLSSGVFLDGDDIPVGALGDDFQALAGHIRPGRFPGVAHIAVIVRGGSVAAVVLRDRPSAIVHMDHLDIRDPRRMQDAREVLHGILGETVANEEDPQAGLHVEGGVDGRRISGGDGNGDRIVTGTVGILLPAQISDLVSLGVDVPDGIPAIIGAHAPGCDTAVEHGGLIHIAEENAAVRIVRHHFTIVLQIPVGAGIGKAHDPTHTGVGGGSDVSVVLAAGHAGVVGNEADHPAQTSCAGGGHGIELVPVIFAVNHLGAAVRGSQDTGRTARLRSDVSVVVAGRDGIRLGIIGRGVGEAHDAGHVDRLRVPLGVGGIRGRDFAPVMHTVHGSAQVLGVAPADEGHMHESARTAVVRKRRIAGHIPDLSIIDETGDHPRAQGYAGRNRQGTVVLDHKILDHGARTQGTEQAIVPACDGLLANQMQVLDMESVAVKLAGKGMSFPLCKDGFHAAVPGSRGKPRRHEIGDPFKIDVIQEVHPSFRILPLGRGLTGIHRRGKGFEFVRGGDALRHLPVHVEADGKNLVPRKGQRAGTRVMDGRLVPGHFLKGEFQAQLLLVARGHKKIKLSRHGSRQGFGADHIDGLFPVQRSQGRRVFVPAHRRLPRKGERGVGDPDAGHGAFLAFYGRQFKPKDGAQALESPFAPGLSCGHLSGRNDAAHRQLMAGILRDRGRHREGDGSPVQGEGFRRVVGERLRIPDLKRLGIRRDKDAPIILVFGRQAGFRDIHQDPVVIVPGDGPAGEIDGRPGADRFDAHGEMPEIPVDFRGERIVFLYGTTCQGYQDP